MKTIIGLTILLVTLASQYGVQASPIQELLRKANSNGFPNSGQQLHNVLNNKKRQANQQRNFLAKLPNGTPTFKNVTEIGNGSFKHFIVHNGRHFAVDSNAGIHVYNHNWRTLIQTVAFIGATHITAIGNGGGFIICAGSTIYKTNNVLKVTANYTIEDARIYSSVYDSVNNRIYVAVALKRVLLFDIDLNLLYTYTYQDEIIGLAEYQNTLYASANDESAHLVKLNTATNQIESVFENIPSFGFLYISFDSNGIMAAPGATATLEYGVMFFDINTQQLLNTLLIADFLPYYANFDWEGNLVIAGGSDLVQLI